MRRLDPGCSEAKASAAAHSLPPVVRNMMGTERLEFLLNLPVLNSPCTGKVDPVAHMYGEQEKELEEYLEQVIRGRYRRMATSRSLDLQAENNRAQAATIVSLKPKLKNRNLQQPFA